VTFTSAAHELLKRLEGLRLDAYRDEGGRWTIGYGHVAGAREGLVWTEAQADAALDADLARVTGDVAHLVQRAPAYLSDAQFSALCIFTFNVGTSRFAGSTALRDVLSGHLDAVPAELMRWHYVHDASGVPVTSEGLLRRRMAEADLWNSGGRDADVA
jgi:lysozyme